MSSAVANLDQNRPAAHAWADRVARMDVDDLRMLAVSMPLIEQAKGILMGHYGCSATTAFQILQRWSSTYGVKLRDVAAALVDEATRSDEQRSSPVERFLNVRKTG
jgi:AmiR/NasT family two-component response regulator